MDKRKRPSYQVIDSENPESIRKAGRIVDTVSLCDAKHLWTKRIPRWFTECFEFSELQIQPITDEMKSRDACGLLTQKNSIHWGEIPDGKITLLVDRDNWAVAFKTERAVVLRDSKEGEEKEDQVIVYFASYRGDCEMFMWYTSSKGKMYWKEVYWPDAQTLDKERRELGIEQLRRFVKTGECRFPCLGFDNGTEIEKEIVYKLK